MASEIAKRHAETARITLSLGGYHTGRAEYPVTIEMGDNNIADVIDAAIAEDRAELAALRAAVWLWACTRDRGAALEHHGRANDLQRLIEDMQAKKGGE